MAEQKHWHECRTKAIQALKVLRLTHISKTYDCIALMMDCITSPRHGRRVVEKNKDGFDAHGAACLTHTSITQGIDFTCEDERQDYLTNHAPNREVRS